MTFEEALPIVAELARQNIIDFDHEDEELNLERARQTEACDVVDAHIYFNTFTGSGS